MSTCHQLETTCQKGKTVGR